MNMMKILLVLVLTLVSTVQAKSKRKSSSKSKMMAKVSTPRSMMKIMMMHSSKSMKMKMDASKRVETVPSTPMLARRPVMAMPTTRPASTAVVSGAATPQNVDGTNQQDDAFETDDRTTDQEDDTTGDAGDEEDDLVVDDDDDANGGVGSGDDDDPNGSGTDKDTDDTLGTDQDDTTDDGVNATNVEHDDDDDDVEEENAMDQGDGAGWNGNATDGNNTDDLDDSFSSSQGGTTNDGVNGTDVEEDDTMEEHSVDDDDDDDDYDDDLNHNATDDVVMVHDDDDDDDETGHDTKNKTSDDDDALVVGNGPSAAPSPKDILTACRCDATGTCLDEPLTRGSRLRLCIFAPPTYSFVDIVTYELVQGDLLQLVMGPGAPNATGIVGQCADQLCMLSTSITDRFYERATVLTAVGVARVRYQLRDRRRLQDGIPKLRGGGGGQWKSIVEKHGLAVENWPLSTESALLKMDFWADVALTEASTALDEVNTEEDEMPTTAASASEADRLALATWLVPLVIVLLLGAVGMLACCIKKRKAA